MAFQFHLAEKTFCCLKSQPERRLTAREIAEWIFIHYRKDCEDKRRESIQAKLSDDNALIQPISAQLKLSLFAKNDKIKIIAGRPRRFYWTEKTDTQEITETKAETCLNEEAELGTELKEAELYPLLAEFPLAEFGIYSKRIDEKNQ